MITAILILILFYGTVGVGALLVMWRRQRAILETLLAYVETVEDDTRAIHKLADEVVQEVAPHIRPGDVLP